MSPYHHAQSSARKWGDHPSKYIAIHDWFDNTKQYTGDWTHRALRHHSVGVQEAIEKFGHFIAIMRDDKRVEVPVKLIAEQHILEDCGFIPTPADWLCVLAKHPEDWMLKVKTTTKMQIPTS
ncbi:MAG: DUF6915 family protein [Akkermansiaceae bacterium]